MNFDQHAASYDQQWIKLAPIRDGLDFLVATVLAKVPRNARILCVGAGTGAEIFYLGKRFPDWHFTAVEPSAPMLAVCRRRATEHGMASRCVFHEGYLDSLAPSDAFDAATALFVSQFIVDQAARSNFFRAIAARLAPSGYLVSADLASDMGSATYKGLIEVWLQMMASADVAPELLDRMRAVYGREVAVLPSERVGEIIATGGFDSPIQFFQGALMHAWYCRKRSATPITS